MTSNDLKKISIDLKMTSKDINENYKPVSKKLKTENKLKGGHSNDSLIDGRVLIEQALSSN